MSKDSQRRYIRYEIKLAATIVVDNSYFIPCTIRDFCAGGLLLESQKNDPSLILQKDIQIFFSTNTRQGLENFKQTAKVIRVDNNDIGVSFENSSTATFEALKNEYQKSLNLIAPDKKTSPTHSSKQKLLETDFFPLLKESLSSIINDFCQQAEQDLAKAAEQTNDICHNTALTEASFTLKQNKQSLLHKFLTHTQKESYLSLAQSSEKEKSSLSLLDQDDFEDWLNLSAIIKSLESKYQLQLEQIQKKIAFLTKVHKNKIVNPASPQKICDSFQAVIDIVDEDIQIKRTLYTIFGKVLSKHLPDIYKRMDAILMENGAPEKIANETSWLKDKPKIVEPKQIPQINTEFTQTTDTSVPPSQGVFDTNQAASFNSQLAPSNNGFTNSQAMTQSPPNYDHSNFSTPRARKNQKPIVDVANNLLHLIQGKDIPQSGSEETAPSGSEYSAEDINVALSKLQENITQNSFLSASSTGLTQNLTETLDTFSDLQKNLSTTDKKNLQIYERLFDVLFNDIIYSNNIKQYLERIHLPIIGQAMLDPNFIESENNVAKNIVNHLSFLEHAVQENKVIKNKNINQTLDTLISKLSKHSLADSDIFPAVEQQLKEISGFVSNSVDRSIKRIIASYEGKQNLEKARYSVQKQIDQRLVGKKIPKIIVALLEAGWQHLLVISTLNKDNISFQNFFRIINNLTGWLTTPEAPSPEQAKATLKFIDDNLKSVCSNTFLHDEIIENINSLLLKRQLLPGSDAMKPVSLKPTKRRSSPEYIAEIEQLNEGDWIDFSINKKPEPLKLIWIGKLENIYVFVNRSGIKKLELKGNDLADRLNNGSANQSENLDQPVMNRATNTMLQKMHEKLIHNALHDPVTELFNRKEFIKQLKREQNNPDHTGHLLFNIEIQDFRLITTSCGLDSGDALLKQFSLLLKSNFNKENAIIARLDNKIFAILLKNRPANAAQTIAEDIQSKLINTQFKWHDKSYPIAISMGVVPISADSVFSLDNILQKADFATLSANKSGRNRIQIHNEEDKQLKSQYNIHEWAGHIDQVFSDNRLFLRCQKITAIDPKKESQTHYEILLGIKDKNGKIIPPDEFIPAVESCQRMSEIDRWVVDSVFSWIENNEFDFEIFDGFSINLSGESLNSASFLAFLKQKLSTSQINLEKITFEITETVAAENFIFAQKFIKEIKYFNCKFSLDDFGSGYSSYSYLKSLDVDYLKIDGAFVKDILNNKADVAIVKSMNEISHALGLETIAEYVENDEIQNLLEEIGVDYVQGWNIQKPVLLSTLA